jgi:hypothetical protein
MEGTSCKVIFFLAFIFQRKMNSKRAESISRKFIEQTGNKIREPAEKTSSLFKQINAR